MSDDKKIGWHITRRTVQEVFADGVPLTFINSDTLSFQGQPVDIETDDPNRDYADAVLVCAEPTRPVRAHSVVTACDGCMSPIMMMKSAPPVPKRLCVSCATRAGLLDPWKDKLP